MRHMSIPILYCAIVHFSSSIFEHCEINLKFSHCNLIFLFGLSFCYVAIRSIDVQHDSFDSIKQHKSNKAWFRQRILSGSN